LVVIVKYGLIVLRADDNGQGGTIALYSLLCRFGDYSLSPPQAPDLTMSSFTTRSLILQRSNSEMSAGEVERLKQERRRLRVALILQGVVIFGVSLLLGDGVLTPAISVLSAVEGIAVQAPNFEHAIVPVTCVILLVLFLAQSWGTGMISGVFSPIVVLWLVSNACIGAYNISTDPTIFRVMSPSYAFRFFITEGQDAWILLGAVMLCITGTEALFADLGHFSRNSIQLATLFFVYPCLMLTYLGQAARITEDPTIVSKAYWLSIPESMFWYMFILAILATIVASQALISASFSIIKQCMSLNCFPKVQIVHTSAKHAGQIYSPDINYILMLACILVVIAFGSSNALAGAYGIAVSLDAFMTTCLVTAVMITVWERHWSLAVAFFVIFGTVDVSFLSANLLKVPHGGWFPLVLAVVVSLVMGVWRWGKLQATGYRYRFRGPYRDMFRVLALSSPLDAPDEDSDDVTVDEEGSEADIDRSNGGGDDVETETDTENMVGMNLVPGAIGAAEIEKGMATGGGSGSVDGEVEMMERKRMSVAASAVGSSSVEDGVPVATTGSQKLNGVPIGAGGANSDVMDTAQANLSEQTGGSKVASPATSIHLDVPSRTRSAAASMSVVVIVADGDGVTTGSKVLHAVPSTPTPSISFATHVPPPIGILTNSDPTPSYASLSAMHGDMGTIGLGYGLPTARTVTSDRRIQIVDHHHRRARTTTPSEAMPTPRGERDSLAPSGPDELSNVARFPGVGLFYAESGRGIPGVFAHWVNCVGSIPQVVVFVTLRHTHVPYVPEAERWHVQVGLGWLV
ncbi:putative potassium transport system protein kup 3, partial [Gonapodya sp. JEL0774]